MADLSTFHHTGVLRFPPEASVSVWVKSVAPIALGITQDPTHQNAWLRHGKTWFVGVNSLDNDASGAGAGFPPLTGSAMEAARQIDPNFGLDPAQISVCYTGYPRQDPSESDAAYRFRKNRFAAHLDGLLPEGTPPRRFLRDYHGFVLGVPLNAAPPQAAPLMVWPGSHRSIQDMLRSELGPLHESDWGQHDLTDAYTAARKHVLDRIDPIPVHVPLGGSYIVHRFAIHGVAPWAETVSGPTEGRMIAYFRPDWSGALQAYLNG